MSDYTPYLLGGLWAWDAYDKYTFSRFEKKYKPVPIPEKPNYLPEDVSIIVPTIDTDPAFTDCLLLWLRHEVREIIIVTIDRQLEHVKRLAEPAQEHSDKVVVLSVPQANKRGQLQHGINSASGKILALVDDDVFWTNMAMVPHLLAPFEDAAVGACCGLQSADIAPERQNTGSITAWEVASIFSLYRQNQIQAVRYACDGGCWFMTGRTIFVRAALLNNPTFAKAFTHETFGGQLKNTGDDVFITQYLQQMGWKTAIQNSPEAEIFTEVMIDRRYCQQMIRWQRDAIQYYSQTLFGYPGIFTLYKRNPYTTRQMVERLLRPIITWTYILTWMKNLKHHPELGLAFAIYFIIGWLQTYGNFVKKYPYCARKAYAAFLTDNCWPVVDLIAWATVSDQTWMTRGIDQNEIIQEVEREIEVAQAMH
ncbi:family 2 glycosyltransferase [Xylariomycetidae sp. FL0641]|nr:family 2 glycosyltransferase [Xylariomycetidae sp. FL0641]